jgi:hypothetical protein
VPTALPPVPPVELPPVPTALPPLPTALPPEPTELPPVPAALPPVPVFDPPITPLTQALKSAQAVIPRQALYAFWASVRAALDIEFSDVLITFWHWAALIPESAPQLSAFRQTSPATSEPLAPAHPITPTASRTAAAAFDKGLVIAG